MPTPAMPLLKLLIQICLLRTGPQALPAAPKLLSRSLIAYVTVGVIALMTTHGFRAALVAALADAALMLVLLQVALVWRGRRARFLQTATALAGTGAVLGLLLLPVLGLAGGGTEVGALASLLWLLLFGWSLAVAGHILREAFETQLPVGVLAALVYFLLSFGLVDRILGGTA